MTKKQSPTYQSINQLPAFGGNISSYVAKSQLLDSLTLKMNTFLDPAYQGQCRIANIRGKTAVIQVLHYALATRLQYELPQLKQKLQSLGLGIDDISVIVKPDESPACPNTRKVNKPSALAGQVLRAGITTLDDPDLQASLARLAQNFDAGKTD